VRRYHNTGENECAGRQQRLPPNRRGSLRPRHCVVRDTIAPRLRQGGRCLCVRDNRDVLCSGIAALGTFDQRDARVGGSAAGCERHRNDGGALRGLPRDFRRFVRGSIRHHTTVGRQISKKSKPTKRGDGSLSCTWRHFSVSCGGSPSGAACTLLSGMLSSLPQYCLC
jgi:hypothetical protein